MLNDEQRSAFHSAAKLLREDYYRALTERDRAVVASKDHLAAGEVTAALVANELATQSQGLIEGYSSGLTQVHMIAKRFGLDGPLG